MVEMVAVNELMPAMALLIRRMIFKRAAEAGASVAAISYGADLLSVSWASIYTLVVNS